MAGVLEALPALYSRCKTAAESHAGHTVRSGPSGQAASLVWCRIHNYMCFSRAQMGWGGIPVLRWGLHYILNHTQLQQEPLWSRSVATGSSLLPLGQSEHFFFFFGEVSATGCMCSLKRQKTERK